MLKSQNYNYIFGRCILIHDFSINSFTQLFDKEYILRLGQQYDKDLTKIEEISTNSPWHQKQKDNARSFKAKNICKVRQDLRNFYRNNEIFTEVDKCRTIDLPGIWDELKNEQKKKFVEYVIEYHPDDMMTSQFEDDDDIKFEKVSVAMKRWTRSAKEKLNNLKMSQPVVTRIVQIPNERKTIPRERDQDQHDADDAVFAEAKIFHIEEPGEYTGFHIDEFPHDWEVMKTRRVKDIWDIEEEERLKFIFSLLYKRLEKIFKNLEPKTYEHYNMSALLAKHCNKKKGKSYENYAVLATTVHGAVIHKQALYEVLNLR